METQAVGLINGEPSVVRADAKTGRVELTKVVRVSSPPRGNTSSPRAGGSPVNLASPVSLSSPRTGGETSPRSGGLIGSHPALPQRGFSGVGPFLIGTAPPPAAPPHDLAPQPTNFVGAQHPPHQVPPAGTVGADQTVLFGPTGPLESISEEQQFLSRQLQEEFVSRQHQTQKRAVAPPPHHYGVEAQQPSRFVPAARVPVGGVPARGLAGLAGVALAGPWGKGSADGAGDGATTTNDIPRSNAGGQQAFRQGGQGKVGSPGLARPSPLAGVQKGGGPKQSGQGGAQKALSFRPPGGPRPQIE